MVKHKGVSLLSARLREHDVKARYQLPNSLLKHLPWVDFDDEHQAVVLQDESVGAVYELFDVAVNGKSENFLIDFRNSLQHLFQDVFTLYDRHESPWVAQLYFQKDPSLTLLHQSVAAYIPELQRHQAYSQHFLSLMQQHSHWLSRPEGIFTDDKVTGSVYRGGFFKVRLVLYRKPTRQLRLPHGRSLLKDLAITCTRLEAKLQEIGITTVRYDYQRWQEWLVRWFNPHPAITQGNLDTLLDLIRSEDLVSSSQSAFVDDLVFGSDFSEQLFFSVPKSDAEKGFWYFDEKPHCFMTLQSLRQVPKIGHMSRERLIANNQYALIDKMPAGAVFVMTVVLQSSDVIKNHLARIEKTAKKSGTMAAAIAFEDCQFAKEAIERGNDLFPVTMGIYLCGKNDADLRDKVIETEALFINQGFQILHGDYDLLPLHSYLNQLPMCYDYAYDQVHFYRSGYVFAKQIANLMPLYGRSRGTGHPGFVFFNRGGEPLLFDPLSPKDKDNNSYLLLLGAAGSGKSSTSIYLMMQMMAIYRPRLVIVDAGNSFGLLADYFTKHGLSVHRVTVQLSEPPILNPFVHSREMLRQLKKNSEKNTESHLTQWIENFDIETELSSSDTFPSNEDVSRDYMGEMLLACQLMITGGEKKEVEAMTRQDRLYIVEALIKGAQVAEQQGYSQMIASDVVAAFREMAGALSSDSQALYKVARLHTMADSLDFFCQDALSAQVFNCRGEGWPEADITLFEQGIFKDEGYEAHNVLAYMGLMSRVMAKAEQTQYEARQTIVFADEVHTLLRVPLMALYLTKCAKMSRKLGLWLWMATQNIGDFSGEAQKILSMVEFWLCLGLSEAEIKTLEEFRMLTDEERELFRSVRKSAKKYVEGVLLCPRLKTLFRNIPPRLCLSLAMTEKQEKAERKQLMQQDHLSELEAAEKIAQQMMDQRL